MPNFDISLLKDMPMLSPEDIADAAEYILATPPTVQVYDNKNYKNLFYCFLLILDT